MTPDDPRFPAAIDLIGQTGALHVQVRMEDSQHPVIWFVVAEYARDGDTVFQVGAALDPVAAAFRLCDQLLDGGLCTYCKRVCGFTEHFNAMPADQTVCWWQYDPELRHFRRGCEGDDK